MNVKTEFPGHAGYAFTKESCRSYYNDKLMIALKESYENYKAPMKKSVLSTDNNLHLILQPIKLLPPSKQY